MAVAEHSDAEAEIWPWDWGPKNQFASVSGNVSSKTFELPYLIYDDLFYIIVFSKYWGNVSMGRPPTSNFGSTFPQFP